MREKLSNYLLDISKLIIAGLVINTIFEITEQKILVLFSGLIFSILIAVIGLIITKK